jgi:hypothetical protein
MINLKLFKKPGHLLQAINGFKWLIAKVVLSLAVLVLSIKPFFFTWNFIQAVFYLHNDQSKAGPYMSAALTYKPSVFKIFNENHSLVFERSLVKTAIYSNNKNVLDSAPGSINLSNLHMKFKDNFYLQNLLGNIAENRDWENLDEVSLNLLADESMNSLTVAIIKKIDTKLDRVFIRNLADFVFWKGNIRLKQHLVSAYPMEGVSFCASELKVWNFNESQARLKAILFEKYKLSEDEIGKNLIQCPGFTTPGASEKRWYFSKMASKTVFSRGSFVMGPDQVDSNPVIRVMGFFVSHRPDKSKPRAGVRYRKKFTAENGFYIFSFDYCTVTGGEKPSFWLANGLAEKHLPPTQRKWQKVVFLLNNSANTYKQINPLVRIWGTGTLLVDNIFLAKITTPGFSIPKPYELLIEK